MVRRLIVSTLAVALACAAPSAVAKTPLGPGPSGGFYTFTARSDLEGRGPVADLAGGFDVWIDPSTAHATRIASAVQYAVGQLARYGIPVHYKGIASRGKLHTGIITVNEAESTT